jgi:serine/threonine-protein kinase
MLVGTVEYMAPEQIMGRSVDARTDIYSLGVVLYRMLAGKPPFKDGGVPALIHQHLNVAPKPIADLAPDVPPAVERAVLRALAKQPDDRFGTMLDLAEALGGSVEPAPLVNLEYGSEDEADPYALGDATQIARSSSPAIGGVEAPAFDEATIKMDRARIAELRGDAPALPPLEPAFVDETAVMIPRNDESTAKRAIPEEIARRERAAVRTCAMCQTMNPPHARACSACGVSLAPQDQEAVRARVSAPRTAHMPAPQMPPPISGAYAAGPFVPSPPQGIPSAPSWGGQPPPPPRPPPSAWERFLAWAGLRR